MATNSRTAPSGLAVGVTTTAAIILIIGGVCHAMQGVVGSPRTSSTSPPRNGSSSST